jgi:hypothetical protein
LPVCGGPAERQICEANAPPAVVEFGQTDRLARQRMTDEDKFAAPF